MTRRQLFQWFTGAVVALLPGARIAQAGQPERQPFLLVLSPRCYPREGMETCWIDRSLPEWAWLEKARGLRHKYGLVLIDLPSVKRAYSQLHPNHKGPPPWSWQATHPWQMTSLEITG